MKEKYEEIKKASPRGLLRKASQEIVSSLNECNLTTEERQELERAQAQIAGFLLSHWLPGDWGRRAIMIFIFLIGLYGIIYWHPLSSLIWLMLLIFSPRVVGEVVCALGKIVRK